jgi:hypothetical protein
MTVARPVPLAMISIVLFLGRPAHPQSITGSVSGAVLDPARLPVAGAEVSLTSATGVVRRAATDEAGRFFFGSLQPGEYALSVSAPGFKRLERAAVPVAAAETLALGDLTLSVGALSESVEVTGEAAFVQVQSGERSGLLTGQQVERLAIRGRNVMSLLSLLPGVVDLAEPEQMQQNWEIYALGNRRNTNNVSLDGATLNAIGNNFNSVVNVSMDAVAEVRVLMSNYQAEYGRLSGADVHLVTKSGTRQFHGLASYWKRHEQFNANNFFNNMLGLPKPVYRFNTWNYNVGGPIYVPGLFNRDRQKLFFFWSQELWPLTVTLPLAQGTVPTELERAGNFSQSLDVNNRLIAVRDTTTGQSFTGNVVPASRINPSGQALLKVFPLPNVVDRAVTGGNYNYVYQDRQQTPQRSETLKVDYNRSSNNLFSFNYTHRRSGQEGALDGRLFPQIRENSVNEGRVYIGRYQRIFSPSLILEANASYSSRPWNNTIDPDSLHANERGAVGFTAGQFHPEINPLGLIPNAQFGGVPNASQPTLDGRTPLTTTHKILTASNSVTKTRGAHVLKAGFYIDRIWAFNQSQSGPFNGSFDFGRNTNNPLDTNYAYSNAILGVFASYTEPSARPFPQAIVGEVEWFAQDNWKVTRRLTLDYGMRFYVLPHSFVAPDRLSGFSAARFDPAKAAKLIQPAIVAGQRVGVHPVTNQVYPVSAIGAIAPGTGDSANGMIAHSLDASVPSSLMDDRGVHFGPRFGFAFDPFGNAKTAVRGGFGLFYNRMAQGMVLYDYTVQPPFVQSSTMYNGTIAQLLQSAGVIFPASVLGLDRQGKIPTVMNYSVSVQRNVGAATVVDVGYVGSLGRHLLWARNLNAIPFGTNFRSQSIDPTTNRPYAPAFLRTYTGYNDVTVREPGATSSYHSMQVSANRRYGRGLQLGAAWTWSRTLDFADNDNTAVSTLVPVRTWNYGLAGFDRTHVARVNWLWDLPKTRWTNPLLSAVLHNWQLSGIASFVSGAPLGVGLSTTTSVDITGSPTDGARTVVTGDPVLSKDQRTFYRYFNTDAFRLPAVGTFGNAAKTVIRGPGTNNWDMAVYKRFPLRERAKLELRCELYNAFNHTQFSAVDTAARFDPTGAQVNTRFGQLTAARNPRQMQLAARFYF